MTAFYCTWNIIFNPENDSSMVVDEGFKRTFLTACLDRQTLFKGFRGEQAKYDADVLKKKEAAKKRRKEALAQGGGQGGGPGSALGSAGVPEGSPALSALSGLSAGLVVPQQSPALSALSAGGFVPDQSQQSPPLHPALPPTTLSGPSQAESSLSLSQIAAMRNGDFQKLQESLKALPAPSSSSSSSSQPASQPFPGIFGAQVASDSAVTGGGSNLQTGGDRGADGSGSSDMFQIY
uniref:Uncharacterized protein n=1 Tax=Chromera velia CCMP2878 TaxID=1169474 RepID=A0A0G4HLC9_9ALVE|eukprot:Cvel_28960.t1-p1 / transcript=Cvel_28960.t1 / gene=Cvel_28960 / organism=Chromera_velia_CCMP2878 / gene_product=hypothetical protein / transcript_product=hypothetical protein / location=Cvel_scaffold3887:10252-10956(+) / protein_length=235 / sequence_SO=supercontig / SO=protein_coding / is_pseudo=false